MILFLQTCKFNFLLWPGCEAFYDFSGGRGSLAHSSMANRNTNCRNTGQMSRYEAGTPPGLENVKCLLKNGPWVFILSYLLLKMFII